MVVKKNLNESPLQYIIFKYWYRFGKKIKKQKIQNIIYGEIENYVIQMLQNQNHIEYLSYELIIDKEVKSIKIKCFNIVSALWFIDIYPINPQLTYNANKCLVGNKHYYFNEKTMQLEWKSRK